MSRRRTAKKEVAVCPDGIQPMHLNPTTIDKYDFKSADGKFVPLVYLRKALILAEIQRLDDMSDFHQVLDKIEASPYEDLLFLIDETKKYKKMFLYYWSELEREKWVREQEAIIAEKESKLMANEDFLSHQARLFMKAGGCGYLSIRDRALVMSGLTIDQAFLIDETNLVNDLHEEVFFLIAETFFEKIYETEDPNRKEFHKRFFAHKDMDELTNDFSDYLVQRLGGPDFFTNRKGFPALLCRHSNITITPMDAEEWLMIMEEVLTEVEYGKHLNSQARDMLSNFFRYTAYYIVAGQMIESKYVRSGCQDKSRRFLL